MNTTKIDASILVAVARKIADETTKMAEPGEVVEVSAGAYVSVFRALELCASGRHTEALQHLANAAGASVDRWRELAVDDK